MPLAAILAIFVIWHIASVTGMDRPKGMEGKKYSIKNPDKVADILCDASPELDKKLVKASQKYMKDQYKADVKQWGYINPKRWNAFYNWLNKNKPGLRTPQKKYPSQLSGGMRQRAALLRTYMFSKDVALLDEAILLSDRICLLTGKPGRITEEIVIKEPKPRRKDFNLTEEFLEYKRQIIEKL